MSSAFNPGAQDSEEFLELSNGCLCCSVKDTGVAAIENLMKRKGAFDYILVGGVGNMNEDSMNNIFQLETTGLADPGMPHVPRQTSERLFTRSRSF